MQAPRLENPREIAARAIPGMSRNPVVIARQLRAGNFPPGVACRPCGRWLLNVDRLIEWLAAGGNLGDSPTDTVRSSEPEQGERAGA